MSNSEQKDFSDCLTMSDTGQGINPDFLQYVFDRFRQADSSLSRKQGGLGIGLSIVRHLVEAHGGTVEAFSEGVGKGSIFTVRLPGSHTQASRLLREPDLNDLPKEVPIPRTSGAGSRFARSCPTFMNLSVSYRSVDIH